MLTCPFLAVVFLFSPKINTKIEAYYYFPGAPLRSAWFPLQSKNRIGVILIFQGPPSLCGFKRTPQVSRPYLLGSQTPENPRPHLSGWTSPGAAPCQRRPARACCTTPSSTPWRAGSGSPGRSASRASTSPRLALGLADGAARIARGFLFGELGAWEREGFLFWLPG